MTDQAALLRTILERPECDTARLVYADWLEEFAAGSVTCPTCNGTGHELWSCKVCGAEPRDDGEVEHGRGCYRLSSDGGGSEYPDLTPCAACEYTGVVSNGNAERAEFIRVQVQAAQCEVCHGKRTFHYGDYLCHNCQPLYNRLHELFANSGPFWWNNLPGQWRATIGADSIETADGFKFFIRRGFVATVRCQLSDWVGGESLEYYARRNIGSGRFVTTDDVATRSKVIPAHGPRIVAEQPVERVEITDARWSVRPGPFSSHIELPNVGRSVVDPKILVMHPDEESARKMLSDYLVNWARREAGLPPAHPVSGIIKCR